MLPANVRAADFSILKFVSQGYQLLFRKEDFRHCHSLNNTIPLTVKFRKSRNASAILLVRLTIRLPLVPSMTVRWEPNLDTPMRSATNDINCNVEKWSRDPSVMSVKSTTGF